MKTVRMAQLVEHAGRPRIHLAWTDPARDPDLQRAQRGHRLVTIQQETRGAKKDHGTVGMATGRGVQFLIFPKSLRRFEGARIVGIHYAQLGSDVSLGPLPPVPRRKQAAAPATEPPKRAPRQRLPQNVVRFEHEPASRSPAPAPRPKPHARSMKPASPPLDPLQRELTAALEAIRGGRVRDAERRLERLLREHRRSGGIGGAT